MIWRKVIVWLAGVIVICSIIIAGTSYFLYTKSGPLKATTHVVIPHGTSVRIIGTMLKQQQIIEQEFPFLVSVYLTGTYKNLKAGEYVFDRGMSLKHVVGLLYKGSVYVRKVTIPEGYTTYQVIDVLQRTEGLVGNITVSLREGELLPDTYFFSYGDQRNQLLLRMKEKQVNLLKQLWPNRDPNLPFSNVEEAITLASIVEKETGKPSERALIAGVFINRLTKGMMLQSDPTTIYAITSGKESLGRLLTKRDLSFDSPYNTYVVRGLPPAPIANPGIAAIEAVLHPAKTEALFFVTDGRGGHRFAASLEEHNRNVATYRASVVEQKLKKEQENRLELEPMSLTKQPQ